MTDYNKYFITRARGGFSNCLDRGQGNVLPNCVGYAWGLFYFFHGEKRDTQTWNKRPRGDANTIYETCKKNGSGFWVSREVKENSILCYNVGEKGHVVYCHYKTPDGLYICSESNYSGTISNGRYLRYMLTPNPKVLYKNFQGCVYDFT